MIHFHSKRQQQIVIAASLVVVVGSAIWLWRVLFPPSGSLNKSLYQQVGIVAGEQTVRLAGATGTVVVWRIPNRSEHLSAPSLVERAFDQYLARAAGLRVVAQERGTVDYAELPMMDVIALPGAEFIALLEKHRDAAVLVLLGAAPYLEAADHDRLPTPRPKVLAVCLANSPSKHLLMNGVVDVAIARRNQPLETPANPRTATEWFDRHYQLITTENAETLPW